MENTASDKLNYSGEQEDGTVIYGDDIIANTSIANNIDFGIKARNMSNLKVTKEIENIKIITSSGNVNVDASIGEDGKPEGSVASVQWNKGGETGKGYVWIQRSEEEIVGATLEITYKITVTDENGENMVVRIADYVQDGMTYTEANNDGNGWTLAKASSVKDGDTITSSTVGEVAINKTIDLTNVNTVLVKDVELNDVNGHSYTTNVTLTKTLAPYSDTDIDEYTNYVEIIQTEHEGLAIKDSDSIPGNYDPVLKETTVGTLGTIVTSLDVNGLEKDSAKSLETLAITSPTGENRATTYYILTVAVIAVFATGVVLIKKYAIKK